MRHSHGDTMRGLVFGLTFAWLLVFVAPGAFADDPVETTMPPATTAAPTTSVSTPPVDSNPASTTLPARPTTTVPGDTTTTVAPTTTLGAVPGDDGGVGFATTPAPLIPSAESDPLFHAALTVDDDMRNLSIANIDYLKRVVAHREAKSAAGASQAAFDKVRVSDVAAGKKLQLSKEILRAAALHAYAGFGSIDTAMNSPQVEGGETVLPYRTYVRVTIADATDHVSQAQSSWDQVHKKYQATDAQNRDVQGRFVKATNERLAAKKAVADATAKLALDRQTLAARIAAMPDMAGTNDKLPDVTKLPPGATEVLSPAGTIVVPASVDPRTAVALQFIVAQLGKPYLWGGTGPNSYDCSGLMLRAFQTAGVTTMPRVSQGQQVWATPVDAKDVQPGDLVFFGTPAYHVGVYIGAGLMMDAPFTGAFVRVDRVWSSVSSYGRVVW